MINQIDNLLEVGKSAAVPAAAMRQTGFADLLGVVPDGPVLAKTGKSGVRYCIMPAAGKKGGNNIKSKYDVTAAAARRMHAAELSQFSARAFGGLSGAVAKGSLLVASVVVKDSGRMVATFIPNDAPVVKAEPTKEDIMKLLASMSEDERLALLASK